jgi:dihydrofolate reductase
MFDEVNHMRLTTTTNVSVDGVMRGLGGADEDRRGGFERGGWAIPLLDTETADYLCQVYGDAAAFLFGRRTYEIFAPQSGSMIDPSTNPIAAALNSQPKYVASARLTDPQWAGTTVLQGELATAIGEMNALHDGDLLVPGSGVLLRGCSPTTWWTRSTCSHIPWSSARARGCSPNPVRTSRSSWSPHGRRPVASPSRAIDLPGVLSTKRPRSTRRMCSEPAAV